MHAKYGFMIMAFYTLFYYGAEVSKAWLKPETTAACQAECAPAAALQWAGSCYCEKEETGHAH
jgi:hypothetical protein